MEGEEEAPAAHRGPLIVGVVAIVLGAALIRMSGGGTPPRPQVLGEALVATTMTTGVAPAMTPSATAAPSPRAARPSAPTTTTAAAVTTTLGTTTTTDGSSSSSSSSTPTTAPCPSGAPVAEVRSWRGGTDGEGTWRMSLSGIVTNRTGATVRVETVAITLRRADGSTYEVPAGERPTPVPGEIGDRGQATWEWEGYVPAGAEPVGADVAVAGWSWTDAPAPCITG